MYVHITVGEVVRNFGWVRNTFFFSLNAKRMYCLTMENLLPNMSGMDQTFTLRHTSLCKIIDPVVVIMNIMSNSLVPGTVPSL